MFGTLGFRSASANPMSTPFAFIVGRGIVKPILDQRLGKKCCTKCRAYLKSNVPGTALTSTLIKFRILSKMHIQMIIHLFFA
jgi:hypothetical protein